VAPEYIKIIYCSRVTATICSATFIKAQICSDFNLSRLERFAIKTIVRRMEITWTAFS